MSATLCFLKSLSVDSKAIDQAASIPAEVLDVIKELGLFGQQIPLEYGNY
jgi:acyl-CoA dehydrogenase family protein 9